jgi:hypothetical protein
MGVGSGGRLIGISIVGLVHYDLNIVTKDKAKSQ